MARSHAARACQTVLLAACVCALLPATAASGAFPGANGKIAFSGVDGTGNQDVYTMQPDGSGETRLTTNPASDRSPDWSPDGKRIAFLSTRNDPNPTACGLNCLLDVYVMNADGTNVQHVTPANSHPASRDPGPAWSPDGTEILFVAEGGFGSDLSAISPNGTGERDIALPSDCCFGINDPAWSPDGALIAFGGDWGGGFYSIFTVDSDGSSTLNPVGCCDDLDWSPNGQVILVDTSEGSLLAYENGQFVREYPDAAAGVWSPDGEKIAFIQIGGGLNVMNADGTGATELVASAGEPDWQPIPLNYVRPRGASPLLTHLVPAYQSCTSPNRTHGAPLAFGSCAPPQQASSHLTVGTPDANGQPTGLASVRYTVLGASPANPNDADVGIAISATRVLRKDALATYTGELQAVVGIRLTDRANSPNPGGPGPGTVQDSSFAVTVPCAAGSCEVATTANAALPGAVVEGSRAVWQLGQVQAYDGGPDDVASTTAGNTLFLTQGIFVP